MNETDSFTRTGAERLARTIRDYWAQRGCHVKTRLVEVAGQENMFAVRSSLRAGKPRVTVPAALGVFRL